MICGPFATRRHPFGHWLVIRAAPARALSGHSTAAAIGFYTHAPHTLNKPNEVRGEFSFAKGRLTFATGDPALIQRLEGDRSAKRESTVWMVGANPVQEFVGTFESKTLTESARPQCWRVVMKAKLQK